MSLDLNGSSGVTFNNATAQSGAATGYGQTWQAVTRSSGVTYTNTTGRPICFLMSYGAGSGSNDYVYLTVGSTTMLFIAAVLVSGVVFGQNMAIIPIGSTYSFTQATGVSKNVYELR
jgi:hypothetical protein